MFCDEVEVKFKAGKGGNGALSYRREKFVPRGGADGGNGGKGGDIIFVADENLNTLTDFASRKQFEAPDGDKGDGNNCYGRNGEDLILKVPVGTVVYVEDEPLVDLVKIGDRFVIARGGKGGFGNSHFISSVRQTPDFAELGEPGEVVKARLELRMVADVGIVGLPSCGKSTLISRVSNAKPKIADYPFTTLIPNLGVVDLKPFGGSKGQSFLMADIPGLIEGASEGKGLGVDFLKHISRTGILIHMLDGTSGDPVNDYKVIRKELELYDPALVKKVHVIVVNKIDVLDTDTRKIIVDLFEEAYPKLKKKLMLISAVSGEGIKDLVFRIWKELEKSRKSLKNESVIVSDEVKLYQPHLDLDQRAITATLEGEVKAGCVDYLVGEILPPEEKPVRQYFKVKGKRLEQIIKMTNTDNEGAIRRVYDIFDKFAVNKLLKRLGAKKGDYVNIANVFFEFRG
jgi:GTP-binding protein